MFNRWFLLTVGILTIGSLVLAIWLDTREVSERHDTPAIENNVMTGSAGQGEAQAELHASDHDRLSYVRDVLDTLQNQRARLPYYGELIRIYSNAGIFEQAADWAHRRALLTDYVGDWKEAGSFYLEALRTGYDEEHREEMASQALNMYDNARENDPDNPDILTDLSVVHMVMLKPERSYQLLIEVLDSHPDHLRANFNIGVLLHQMGNAGQSVAFLNKSLALADDSEWEEVIQSYLDRHHDEIYH